MDWHVCWPYDAIHAYALVPFSIMSLRGLTGVINFGSLIRPDVVHFYFDDINGGDVGGLRTAHELQWCDKQIRFFKHATT